MPYSSEKERIFHAYHSKEPHCLVSCSSARPLWRRGILSAPAFAQDAGTTPQVQDQATDSAAQDQAEQAGNSEAIVVTGSRIRRPDLESASPVAVIDAQQIQSQGIVNTQDLLQKLPQIGIPASAAPTATS